MSAPQPPRRPEPEPSRRGFYVAVVFVGLLFGLGVWTAFKLLDAAKAQECMHTPMRKDCRRVLG